LTWTISQDLLGRTVHPVFSEGVLMKWCQRILPDREDQRELMEAIKMVQMTKGDGNLFSVMRLKLCMPFSESWSRAFNPPFLPCINAKQPETIFKDS
jgi:hypothetical protein